MNGIRLAMWGNDRYFVETPKKWGWRNLPSDPTMEILFPAGMKSPVGTVLCASFGAVPDQLKNQIWENYFIVWTDTTPVQSWEANRQVNCTIKIPHYPDLEIWLKGDNVHVGYLKRFRRIGWDWDYVTKPGVVFLQVALGAEYNQFFARMQDATGGVEYRWSQLPIPLNDRLVNHARNKEVVNVALGPKRYWVIHNQSGEGFWDLPAQSELLEVLQSWKNDKKQKGAIKYVSLNPTNDHFFILFEKGEVHWDLPSAWSDNIQEFIDCYKGELLSEEQVALEGTLKGKMKRMFGKVPSKRNNELIKVLLGSGGVVGLAANVVQIATIVAPMCTIL